MGGVGPGITIDVKLKFDNHVDPCASKQIGVLVLFLGLQDIFNNLKKGYCRTHFVMSNFKYCPLIWIFCGKGANNKINKIHKQALRVLFNDYDTPFNDLLARSNEKTVHVQNLQRLVIEIYKT